MNPPQPQGARPERGWLNAIRDELTQFYKDIQRFSFLEPGEVLLQIAGMSARLCELRAHLIRSDDRLALKLRTGEVEPLVEALKLQFQIWSRLIAVRGQEWEMSKG